MTHPMFNLAAGSTQANDAASPAEDELPPARG